MRTSLMVVMMLCTKEPAIKFIPDPIRSETMMRTCKNIHEICQHVVHCAALVLNYSVS